MLNKGLFPFYSFEGTVLEVTEDDDFTMQVAKGAGQNCCEYCCDCGSSCVDYRCRIYNEEIGSN